jgi:OPA family sugar phosphate sensor protein UhpC-like MFS transporter
MKYKLQSLFTLLKSAPEKPEMQDPQEIDRSYKYWRWRVFYTIYVGYALYYFTRKSFSYLMPQISKELGFDKAALGWIGSMLALSYGLSKFVSGTISDKSNPRYFMAIGLIATGVINIIFGTSSVYWVFALCWALNGWFQGFGWPPCAKILSYWYSKNERGRWWAFWNTSHNFGGAIIPVVVAFIADHFGWRTAMYVPGVIAIISGFWIINRLRDTPRTLGLPIVEKYRNDHSDGSKNLEGKAKIPMKELLWKYIFTNKYIWILALSYFSIYVVRTALNEWTMFYLLEHKHYALNEDAAKAILLFEMGGLGGSLMAGWISDRIFKGCRGQTNVFFITALLGVLSIFWFVPYDSMLLDYFLITLMGVFVFGPHMLIGIAAVELSHKEAAASSTGMIGWIGYLGAAAAGGPFGELISSLGWEGFFITVIGATVLTLVFLLPLFSVKNPPKKLLMNDTN